MDGVSSRLGRASSRYGGPSSTAAAAFSGPVRKWKRRWVHVSSSPTVNSRNSSLSNNNAVSSSRLMLCRWTPLATSAVVDTVSIDEPPKRKFRYTPIVALEEEHKKAEKEEADEPKASVADEHSGWKAVKNNDLNVDVTKKEIRDSSGGRLDLEL